MAERHGTLCPRCERAPIRHRKTAYDGQGGAQVTYQCSAYPERAQDFLEGKKCTYRATFEEQDARIGHPEIGIAPLLGRYR